MTHHKKNLVVFSVVICLCLNPLFLLAFGETPQEVEWKTLYQLNIQTGEATPTIKKLDGKVVRIPGYIVPLDGDEKMITEFLLVPTLGACVHVPPPPPNQIVHVIMEKGIDAEMYYYPVWVTGQLNIANMKSELAEASYSMSGLSAEEYEF